MWGSNTVCFNNKQFLYFTPNRYPTPHILIKCTFLFPYAHTSGQCFWPSVLRGPVGNGVKFSFLLTSSVLLWYLSGGHLALTWLSSPLPFFHYGFDFTSQGSSPVHSEKQVPVGAAWEVADFEPEQVETQPRLMSQEEVERLHSGHQEPLNQKRELRPLPKNGKNSEHALAETMQICSVAPNTPTCSE